MSFEYIIEPDVRKTLSNSQKSDIVQKVSSAYDIFNEARQDNLKKANSLIDEIFFKNTFREEKDKTKKWKAKVKMAKVYMLFQTLKAFIWKNTYSTVNSMFDVSGEDMNADNDSNKQKAILVDIFEKMSYPQTCDEIIDNSLIYGELISFTSWKKRYEEYRRPITFFRTLFREDINKLPKILEAIAKGQKYWVDTRKIYDNPYVHAVNPSNFVFYVSQDDDWENCPKIYRTYKTPADIINNKFYVISKDEARVIKDLVSAPEQSEMADQSDERLKDKVVNGNTVEVLEHWGNFKLDDGTVLKNWHVVIVARKYLVRFSKNEALINPFTFGTLIKDKKTKRGISLLYCVLNLALTQEDLINRTYDMQSLSENPPIFAPKGYFTDEELELYPGKVIEFDENLDPTRQITPLQFNSSIFLSDIDFLSNLIHDISGVYPNMMGADEVKAKTATELNIKNTGQMTRLSMILDIINQYLIIPNVKKVASLNANFKSGIERVFINKDNKKEVLEINDEIRQGEYKYTYSDRTATTERINKADTIIKAIQQFAQVIPLNFQEIFSWYFEQLGVENPERFLQQMPSPSEGFQVPGTIPQENSYYGNEPVIQ